MSASEDLQSAVQPAASEALEGFPLSPLQTRALARHHRAAIWKSCRRAPARPGHAVATLERLRRALDGEAQLRVAYRTMPGMSLPVRNTGWARGRSAGRAPAGKDGDWAGRFARESASRRTAPGREASRYWRSACCWTPPERRSRGCCWRRRRSSSMRPAWWRCCAAAWGRPARRARTRETRRCCSAFLRVGQRGAGRRAAKRQRLLARAGGRCGGESAGAGGRPGRGEWTARRLLPARATRTPGSQRLAGGGRPAGLDPGRRAVPGRRGTPSGNGDWSRGACSMSSPSWPDRSPGSRRCAWRMSARAASASSSTPSRRRSSPRRSSGPARSLCPRLAARRVGLRLAGGRTG